LSSELSVAQVLANLEAQMAFHKEREEHHARQEALHGEQRAFHAAEHATVAQAHEAFKASAGGAAEIAARAVASAPEALPPLETVPLNATLPSRLVARAVAEIPVGETFSPSRVAAEVNQRFRAELKKPIDSRQASTTLRRLQAEGVVRLIRKGMPHHEALYVRS
ncbi:MAG TPA: hypothetical protein VGH73_07055, partial [Thermoanaerobaculia bacterium]